MLAQWWKYFYVLVTVSISLVTSSQRVGGRQSIQAMGRPQRPIVDPSSFRLTILDLGLGLVLGLAIADPKSYTNYSAVLSAYMQW